MSTLQLTFARQYRKKQTGKLVFVYNVKGTAAQLDEYRDAQGSYLVEDEKGQPLFFTSRYVGEDRKRHLKHPKDVENQSTT